MTGQATTAPPSSVMNSAPFHVWMAPADSTRRVREIGRLCAAGIKQYDASEPRCRSGRASAWLKWTHGKRRRTASERLGSQLIQYTGRRSVIFGSSSLKSRGARSGAAAACPLRSDRVRTFAPQRIDAVCQTRTFARFIRSPRRRGRAASAALRGRSSWQSSG
jgi:hypothetical protein